MQKKHDKRIMICNDMTKLCAVRRPPGAKHFSMAPTFLWHRGDRWFGAARQGFHELLSDPSLGVAGEVRISPAKDSRRLAWRTPYCNHPMVLRGGMESITSVSARDGVRGFAGLNKRI